MGIVDEDVAAVRAASDIVAVISQYLQLRRVGQRWQGLCPFHAEKTPSFSVNANEGVWYCFGCQASGDVITFVREVENLGFVDAVEWLAGKAGMTLRYTDRLEGEGRRRRAKLVEVMERAVAWYHDRLLSGPDAGAARRYLRERGLDGDVVRDHRIGWAPDAWDELCRALRLDAQDARDTGLGRLNSRGRLQDHFRGRILFPIHDAEGRPVSFGGRILPGTERPGNMGKYMNTTETPLYNKSRVLYGLDRAKAAIVRAGTAVICEGYTDVIAFQRAGVPLAVATCGTALTDEHVVLLHRFAARRLVLAFDADSAGQAAAEKFYRWERQHDLEVAVADLPPGQDPADVGRSDPERLVAAVEGATPFLRFRLERVFGAADLSSHEGRARAAERALEVIAEHPVDLVRDQYVMDVASRCRVEPDRLRVRLDEVRRSPARHASDAAGRGSRGPAGGRGARPGRSVDAGRRGDRDAARRATRVRPPSGRAAADGSSVGVGAADGREVPNEPIETPTEAWAGAGPGRAGARAERPGRGGPGAGGPRSPGPSGGAVAGAVGEVSRRTEGPALELLRHAVHDPAAVSPWLADALFDDPVHAGVYQALLVADTHAGALATSPPAVADLLARLLVQEPTSTPFDAVRRLLTEVARQQIGTLRLSGAGADDATQVLNELAFLNRAIHDLRDRATASESADRLLAWLTHRVGDGG